MRLLARPSRFVWLASLMLSAFGLSSCENLHIGRQCELSVQDDGGTSGSGSTATIDIGLECPSRICLLPAADKDPKGTSSLCTATCDTDEDCQDGESKDMSVATDHRCRTGFACGVATTVGDFCCRKFCICKDFVTVPAGGLRFPAVCESSEINRANCQNVR